MVENRPMQFSVTSAC